MENCLPGIQSGINGQAITICKDISGPSEITGDQQQMPTQDLIARQESIQRSNMPVGYDQDVGGCSGMCIPKSCHQFIAVEYPFGRSTFNYFAKYARRISAPPT